MTSTMVLTQHTRTGSLESAIDDVVEIKHDLSNYVGVGTRRYPVIPKNVSTSSKDWTETSVTAFLDPEDPEYQNLHTLETRQWIRFFSRLVSGCSELCVRIYCIPSDSLRGVISRDNIHLRAAFLNLITSVDVSPQSWAGVSAEPEYIRHIQPVADSLFYVFNTLPSPSVNPDAQMDCFSRTVLDILLDEKETIPGLVTKPYAYQRRSAAAMVEMEAASRKFLDPRLQRFVAADGREIFIDFYDHGLLTEKLELHFSSGGILAEEMGLGKTLICISTILATKDHWPELDSRFKEYEPQRRETVGSLMDMCISTISRKGVPWKEAMNAFEQAGYDFSKPRQKLEESRLTYVVPLPPRDSRTGWKAGSLGRQLTMSTATLIVVPRNLVGQWRSEITKHTAKDALTVLVMNSAKDEIPPIDELLSYDVILFSTQRFEMEQDKLNPIFPSCTCRGDHWKISKMHEEICPVVSTYTSYQSPLMNVHWKRLIVDEGHIMASSRVKKRSVIVAEHLVVDRKWIVSGTPSSGLYGATIALAASETEAQIDKKLQAEMDLKVRKNANKADDADRSQIFSMIADFFHLQPWAGNPEDPFSKKKRSYQGLSAIPMPPVEVIKGLFVRHRIEDVELEVELPPLQNTIIHLEPGYYDRLNFNVFVGMIISNAVSSEREDEDWMFHPANRGPLRELIGNLRRSSLHFVHSPEVLESTYKNSKEFISSNGETIPPADKQMLEDVIDMIGFAVEDKLSKLLFADFDMAILTSGFPESAKEPWCFRLDGEVSDIMKLARIPRAQLHIEESLKASKVLNPTRNLRTEGFKLDLVPTASPAKEKPKLFTGGSPSKKRKLLQEDPATWNSFSTESRKRQPKPGDLTEYQDYTSELSETKILGTSSAKLTYLISRLFEFRRLKEKTIIFFEDDLTALYVKQALEAFNIRHVVYVKAISAYLRSQVAVTFNNSDLYDVLLIDVRQAAHGLNLSTATRIFFLYPVWQPNIEAQAIKRAHRIGQQRPVFVETLVLRGTIEEKLVERRNAMSSVEMEKAEGDLLDDRPMNLIIQNAQLLSGWKNASEEDESPFSNAPNQIHEKFALFRERQEEEDPVPLFWAEAVQGLREAAKKHAIETAKATALAEKKAKKAEQEQAKVKKSVTISGETPFSNSVAGNTVTNGTGNSEGTPKKKKSKSVAFAVV